MSTGIGRTDTRTNMMAAGLVGAVVLVLGFGSGIGAVFSHHTAYSAPSAARTGRLSEPSSAAGSTGDSVDGSGDGVAFTAVPAASTRTTGQSFAAFGPAGSMGSTSAAAAPNAMSAPSGPSANGMSSGTSNPAGSCSNEVVANAMLDPFVAHFDHAHLQESPSQQAADATNPDQYVKTHTVLAEQMIAPGVTAGQASLEGVDPFFMHFDHAHLEESPAQQAADLLNVSQYVKIHTVLIEDMAAPAFDSAMGTYGC